MLTGCVNSIMWGIVFFSRESPGGAVVVAPAAEPSLGNSAQVNLRLRVNNPQNNPLRRLRYKTAIKVSWLSFHYIQVLFFSESWSGPSRKQSRLKSEQHNISYHMQYYLRARRSLSERIRGRWLDNGMRTITACRPLQQTLNPHAIKRPLDGQYYCTILITKSETKDKQGNLMNYWWYTAIR